jgi:WD40 repeat protein
LSGSYDKNVFIFDMKSKGNKPIQTLSESKDSIENIDTSDYEIITASIDGFIRIYDIRNGKIIEDNIFER